MVIATRHPLFTHLGSIVMRIGLVAVLVLIGALKFTAPEAQAIAPLVDHSPFLFWLPSILGLRGTSDFFGAFEIVAGVLIATRFASAAFSAVGSGMAIVIFLCTVSFMFTTPGGLSPSGLGPFLLKDITLLGASIWTFGEALAKETS
jgi:uncharacterized membrane protein YkgB